MFPIPSSLYIPKIHRENTDDPKYLAFTGMIDDQLTLLKNEIFSLQHLKSSVRCPGALLPELAFKLGVTLLPTDTEDIKRHKIFYAMKSYRYKGCFDVATHLTVDEIPWIRTIKTVIDNVTGYSCAQDIVAEEDQWIICGDGVVELLNNYAIIGGDGNSPYGIYLSGSGAEPAGWGNVYIDLHPGVHTAVVSNAQIVEIAGILLDDMIPAYIVVYLCYVNTLGAFEVYTGGTI